MTEKNARSSMRRLREEERVLIEHEFSAFVCRLFPGRSFLWYDTDMHRLLKGMKIEEAPSP